MAACSRFRRELRALGFAHAESTEADYLSQWLRGGQTLADLAAGLGSREAVVCRELTKLHEEIRRGDLATLAQTCAANEPRGEIVLVIAPPQALPPMSVADTETLLREALRRVSVKDAVAEVADATGLPRREVYQRALALTKQTKDDKHGAAR